MKRRALIAISIALCGCAPRSFQAQFKAPEAPNERVVLSQIKQPKPRDERPVAVGITAEPARMFAWDLSAGLLWERPVHALSAPLVVADAIVTREQNGIVVRDLGSGEVRAVVDDDGELIGADGQGHAIAVSIDYGEKADPRAAVAYVEGDSVRWKQPLKLPVGVPALVGRYVLVPWATQRLSVLAAARGTELARWHFKKMLVGHALVDRGHVYIGQHGLAPLDEKLVENESRATAVYEPAGRPLPGQPPLLRDGYQKVPEPNSAYHRVQATWRIAADGTPGAENDLLVMRFYRELFALAANADEVRWARTFEHDLIGSAIQPGGLFVADTSGVLRFIDTAGVTRMKRELGRTLQVLTIRPGAWVPAPSEATPPPNEAPAPTLREQLVAAAALDDDRLAAGRSFAVEHLANMTEPAVTADLIALCSNNKSPQPVQLAACGHLAARTNGGDSVIEAMRRRASFLENADPPPIGALARAASGMNLKKAGALLITHIEDPNTQARDLPLLFVALEKLEHRPAGSAIERFVRLHHAEPEGSEVVPALYAALHALGSLHVKSARGSLQDIASDGLTTAAVRDKARETLAMIDAPPAPPAPKPDPAAKPESSDDASDDSPEVLTDPRPYALSANMVRDALRPVQKLLSACLSGDPSKPHNARVSMVVQGEGHVEGIFVLPTTLQACMEPLLRGTKFPATRLGRQRITHTVFAPNATSDASSAKKQRKAPRKGKAAAPRVGARRSVSKKSPAAKPTN